jgi:hypothetical protein
MILRLYYVRHSFDASDTWVIQFQTLLGTFAVDDLKTLSTRQDSDDATATSLRLMLILCALELYKQGQNSQGVTWHYRDF